MARRPASDVTVLVPATCAAMLAAITHFGKVLSRKPDELPVSRDLPCPIGSSSEGATSQSGMGSFSKRKGLDQSSLLGKKKLREEESDAPVFEASLFSFLYNSSREFLNRLP